MPAAPVMKRPGIVTLLAVLQFIGAGIWFLIGAAVILAVLFESDSNEPVAAGIMMALFSGIAIYQLICGIGLLKLKPYGRIMQIISAAVGLLAFPLGTIISAAILIYITKPGIQLLFSGRPAEALTAEERRQVVAATQSAGPAIAIFAVCGVLVAVAFIGIVAAIAIPAFLRARIVANEAATVSTLRSLLAAEVAYAARNQRYYDTPECLAAPARCLPSYAGAEFLEASSRSTFQKSGYEFSFAPGPAVDPGIVRTRGLSPSSVEKFAVSAVPLTPGTSGRRTFCADETGRIWFTPLEGLPVETTDGSCPDGWELLDNSR
jgi:type II secretory pathway pseudopilin PulG